MATDAVTLRATELAPTVTFMTTLDVLEYVASMRADVDDVMAELELELTE